MRHFLARTLSSVCLLSLVYCTSTRSLPRAEQVPLVTTDIDLFWAAYPAALRDTAHAD